MHRFKVLSKDSSTFALTSCEQFRQNSMFLFLKNIIHKLRHANIAQIKSYYFEFLR